MTTHNVTRYRLPLFRRPQANRTGDWVRYCDYEQDMYNADNKYNHAINKLTVVKEQLDKARAIGDGAKRIADQHHHDNQLLRMQLTKTTWLLPIIVTATSVLSSLVTLFALRG